MGPRERTDSGTFAKQVHLADVLGVFDAVRGPVITSSDVADRLDCTTEAGRRKLRRLYDRGRVDKRKTGRVVVWWQTDAEEDNTETSGIAEEDDNEPREFTEGKTLRLSDPTDDDAGDGDGEGFTEGKKLTLNDPTDDDDEGRREYTEGKTLTLNDPRSDDGDDGTGESVDDAIAAIETPGRGETKQRREQALRDAYDYLREHGEGQRREFEELLGDEVGYASFDSWWANYVIGTDALEQLPNIDPPSKGEHTWTYTGDG